MNSHTLRQTPGGTEDLFLFEVVGGMGAVFAGL